MKALIFFCAVIIQLVCIAQATAVYGFKGGVIVLCAIVANAVQVATQPKE